MKVLFTLAVLFFATNSFCQTYTYVEQDPAIEKEKKDKEAYFQNLMQNVRNDQLSCEKRCGSYAADANNPKDPCTLPGITPKCICDCRTTYGNKLKNLEQQEKTWQIDIARREKNYENQQKQKQVVNNQVQSNKNVSNDINKSIDDAFNTVKENLDKSQKQEEEKTIEPTYNSNSSSLSSKDMFDKGVYAQYTDHDMNNALYWYLKSAKDGYVDAMSTLSSYYSNETTANYAEAAHWWLLAYKNKLENASSLSNIINAFGQNKYQPTNYADIFSIFNITINELGFEFLSNVDSGWVIHSYAKFYEKGQGCNVNLKKAFAIQLKNAKDGDILSMVDLGMYYIDGKGTTKNYQEALRWLTKAIDVDNSFRHNNTGGAMFALGYMYENGLGVEKSLGTAKEWYQKSADALFEPAKNKLQKMDSDANSGTNANEAFITSLNKIFPIKVNSSFEDVLNYEYGKVNAKRINYNDLSNVFFTMTEINKIMSFSNKNSNAKDGLPFIKKDSKLLSALNSYLQSNNVTDRSYPGEVCYYFVQRKLIGIRIYLELDIQEGSFLQTGNESDFLKSVTKLLYSGGINYPDVVDNHDDNYYYTITIDRDFISDSKFLNILNIGVGNKHAYENSCWKGQGVH